MYDTLNVWRVSDFTKNLKLAYENIYLQVVQELSNRKKLCKESSKVCDTHLEAIVEEIINTT
jgi:hypothetical protein